MEILRAPGARSREGREFIELPFRLYRGDPHWVPWFRADLRQILDRRHPFFEHSEGEFFIAREDGRTVGRIAALENRRYNAQHGTNRAHFYLFDAEDHPQAAAALLGRVCDWARSRGLESVAGPMGFGGSSGNGILVDGYGHRAAMTMMSYNHPYYSRLLEGEGFRPLMDLYSAYLDAREFRLPERVRSAAQKVLRRGNFQVLRFRSKRELRRLAAEIGRVYNTALGEHSENYPLSEAEVRRATDELLLVADPQLVKILTYRGKVAGFLFGFPDLSAALQRGRGRLNPLSILDLLTEYRRTDWLICNGAGILPEYQRLGGNALLYYELERTVGSRSFRHVDLTQVASTTSLMLSDVQTLGGRVYKTHRVYSRKV